MTNIANSSIDILAADNSEDQCKKIYKIKIYEYIYMNILVEVLFHRHRYNIAEISKLICSTRSARLTLRKIIIEQ